MSYADLDYYRDTYKGEPETDDTTLQKWLDRATDDIDYVTNNNIDVSTLTVYQLEELKKANCAQSETYVKNGDLNGDGSFNEVSVGSFSIKGGMIVSGGVIISGRAYRYLSNAGLLYRGISVCG
jgi:hypothetical protein